MVTDFGTYGKKTGLFRKVALTFRKINIFRWDFFKPHLLDLETPFLRFSRDFESPGSSYSSFSKTEIFFYVRNFLLCSSQNHEDIQVSTQF